MLLAFEINDEDVGNALAQYKLTHAEEAFILERLDGHAIAKSALHGDELNEQTTYAYQAIVEQVNAKQPEPIYYDVPSMQTTFTAHTLIEQINAGRMGATQVNETIYDTLFQAYAAGHKHQKE